MDDFLTTKQTQEMLKVDRITIYRMLNDGRLKGKKIGQQWRFPRLEVERLLNGAGPSEWIGDASLPVHCLQTIQDLFSTVSQFSASLISPQGDLITTISNPCSFCRLFTADTSSLEACRSSQFSFFEKAQIGETRFTCHAGLHYAGKLVKSGDEIVALFIAGGYKRPGIPGNLPGSITQILLDKGYSESEIKKTFSEVPALPPEQETIFDTWAASAAEAFTSILQERSAFSHRLKKIADLTQIS
jgi:excisionase family DNA binding protein